MPPLVVQPVEAGPNPQTLKPPKHSTRKLKARDGAGMTKWGIPLGGGGEIFGEAGHAGEQP